MDLVVGGGKYGCDAISYLRLKHKGFVLIDSDLACLAAERFGLKPSSKFNSEGEYFAVGGLSKVLELMESLKPEYVFPTVPSHLAADMANLKFKLKPQNDALRGILPNLPKAVVLRVGKGNLILSFNRDHSCRDYCPAPEVCPSSGIKRPCTMAQLMRFASPDAFILVSYTMAPGMGALKGSEIAEFFNWAKPKANFIVGVASDCHGVFSAFKKSDSR
jgi:hypothetical protein